MRRVVALTTLALLAAGGGCAAVLGLEQGSLVEEQALVDGGSVEDQASSVDGNAPDAAIDASGGNECPRGQHRCGATCFPNDFPQYGCGDPSCQPCRASHAVAFTCAAGACTLAASGCQTGWDDCNHSFVDGCEADLNTAATCGTCGKQCAPGEACNAGTCTVDCSPLTKCGTSCVDTSSDPKHCLGCNNACSSNNATPTCTAAGCSFSCTPQWDDCDGAPENACETATTTNQRCGSCNNDCFAQKAPPNAVRSCQNSGNTDTCSGLSCIAGWSDCNGDLALNGSDGCECTCCNGTSCCANSDAGTTCSPPGTACARYSTACCGACEVHLPNPTPNLALGSCCATKGQACNFGQSGGCCAGFSCGSDGVNSTCQ